MTCQIEAQVYSNKVIGAKNQSYADSIKHKEYPYILPILGAKAAKRGYDLPFSAGIGVNYLAQKSDLIIEDLLVGFNNGPMYNIDEIVRINDATATASPVNLRPDIWVLPAAELRSRIPPSGPAKNESQNRYRFRN